MARNRERLSTTAIGAVKWVKLNSRLMEQIENWRKVGNNSSYEVSDQGRVRNITSGLVLKTGTDRYGYEKIHLKRVDENVNFHTTIHRLVALAWVDGWFEGAQVNHKNGVKFDNKPPNLEWVTAKENIVHSYDYLLNANASPVSLTNKETGTVTSFRSVKMLAKFLGIHASSLVPLIRNSAANPILGKYVAQIQNEELAFGLANTTNFGRSIFVLDSVTEKVSEYPSILLASYITGVRSLSNVFKKSNVYQIIGYYFTDQLELLPKKLSIDKEAILQEREEYVNTPYVKRDHFYELYDYYEGKTYAFDDVKSLVNFLNAKLLKIPVTNKLVADAIGKGKADERTGLLRGYGVRSSRDNFNWFPYREEVVITNRENRFALPVFRVKINDVSKDVIGILELYNFLNTGSDKPLSKLTEESIVKSSNIPNLSVVRLVNPIETKTKI